MNLKKLLIGAAGLVTAGSASLFFGKQYFDKDHTGIALLQPQGTPQVAAAPVNWEATQSQRNAAKAKYISDNQIAFNWFADFPFSQTDGTPLIILKLFPLIAPDQWQGGDQFMSEVGLFVDTRSDMSFLPRGIGFSGLDPDNDTSTLDVTSFTCGACHIGRVTSADGETSYIDGAINTTFNINKYYVETLKTLKNITGTESDRDKALDLLTSRILEALDKAETTSPNFFYENYSTSYRTYDAAYEAKQIALFRSDAKAHVESFANYTESFVAAFSDYLDKTYDGYKDQMLAGLPGMADATGVSASHGYASLSAKIGKTLSKIILPDHPGVTDFMAVWEQDARAVEWDPMGKQLINGGGQYNGNIPIPIFRNLAAATTMGLDDPDIRVPAFAAQLLGGLPATPYPFDVDETQAKAGEALFAENCAACHQPNNGAVYDTLGTSPSRSKVINTQLVLSGRKMYQNFCPPELELDLAGEMVKPCAVYEGVSLSKLGTAIMRPLANQNGYNATALRGIWAIAPYLHNGSVPTMRHLLMPGTRPDSFARGLLSYDQENMGFNWQDDGSDGAGQAMLFDTTVYHAVSNKGHDTNITDGEKTYKLDWSDDPAGADALIEYLKTL